MNKNEETKEPTTDWPIDLQPTGEDGGRVDITDHRCHCERAGERGNLPISRLLRRFTPRNDIKN